MARRPPSKSLRHGGLSTLRRLGAVSDLLFLYEAETREIGQLRTLAERLGLSVQAVSHSYRSLRERGLVELRDGRYRPTVRGVDWLHSALGSVRDDLAERLDRLHIVRTTRAVAKTPIRTGDAVTLEIVDGTLTARAGVGTASRGRAHSDAREGELVDVGELEGIVPLPHGRLWVAAVPTDRVHDSRVVGELREAVAKAPPGLLLASGLEAFHLLRRALPNRPLVRFGVAAAIVEATRLGVECTLVAVDRDLPRLFEQLIGPDVPPLEFLPLGHGRGGRQRRSRRQG
jgi:predicted transcriptional regulator